MQGFIAELFQVDDPGINRGEQLSANAMLESGARRLASADCMNWFQIGAAETAAAAAFIGSLSAFPTPPPAASSGVYPTVQPSRHSLVVPVLAAAGLLSRSGLFAPNIGVRASLSLRISVSR